MDRYLEALEQARNYYPDNLFLDTIFPELAESEDERIRKHIVEILDSLPGCYWYGQKEKDDSLAYLEKQKEQKPIKGLYIPKFRKGDTVVSTKNPRLTYQILSVGNINKLGNPEYKVEIFTDGKSDEPRNIKYIEVAKMDDWGKLIEQKPAEWSEEDEVELINIVDFLNSPSTAELCPALRKKAIAWLESLRPQPHWKPSEEQIRRLNNVIITDSRIWGVETKRAMMSLYEDLKKL